MRADTARAGQATYTGQLVSDAGIAYTVTTTTDIEQRITELTHRLRRCSPLLPKTQAMIHRDRDQLIELWATRRKDTP